MKFKIIIPKINQESNNNNNDNNNNNHFNQNYKKNYKKNQNFKNNKKNRKNYYNNQNNNMQNINPFMMNPMMMGPMLTPLQLQQLQLMQMNQMKSNQMNQMGGMGMPAPNQFIQPPMPMIPYPLMMNMQNANPMIMQQIYQQNLMQEKEVNMLNKNFEYQLNRQKEAEMYKVVNDKNK